MATVARAPYSRFHYCVMSIMLNILLGVLTLTARGSTLVVRI